jgi:hypothetical protein
MHALDADDDFGQYLPLRGFDQPPDSDSYKSQETAPEVAASAYVS